MYDATSRRFDAVGANYPQNNPDTRLKGWSYYVLQNRCLVWIRAIKDVEHFEALKWTDNAWHPLADTNSPMTINSRLLEFSVQCEFGIPIIVGAKCIGVSWLKFIGERLAPDESQVSESLAFASHAGLVLETVENQEWRLSHFAVRGIMTQSYSSHFDSSSLQNDLSGRLEGYVSHASLDKHVGGGFHCIKQINEHTVGVFLGDGKGHGLEGFLNALPLVTLFEELGRHSYSARHVMDGMTRGAKTVGIRRDGIYSIFMEIGNRLFANVTQAGPECGVVIIQRNGTQEWPQDGSRNGTLGEITEIPMEEQSIELLPGDTVIGYTDGVCALTGHYRSAWKAVSAIAHEMPDGTVQQIAEAIRDKAINVQSQMPEDERDDISVFVIRVKSC